jgi:DNA adenine methylase
MVASRRIFELYERQDPQTLTDVQRAARYVFLLKNSFGGRPTGRNYHYCVTKPPNYNPRTLPRLLAVASERLERVQLEEWPWQKVLERFDRPTTFYFLDPPYVGLSWYRLNFTDDDFRELADRLRSIRGKFLMTINDCALSREVFGRFHILDIPIVYTASRRVPHVRELVVSNYELPE